MEFLKVSSKSSPASVAGAIAGMVKDGVPVNMQCVGAGAVNQAIKAVAIARGFLIPTDSISPAPPSSPTFSLTVNRARLSGFLCTFTISLFKARTLPSCLKIFKRSAKNELLYPFR